jgi:hypothetical protein
MRVDLEPGRWFTLVDPDEMTHGAKMRVQELLSLYMDDSIHPHVASMKLQEKLIAEVLTGWSLEMQLPKGDSALLEAVPGWMYDALMDATEEHHARLDFLRRGKTSSESKEPSEDTSSPDKSLPSEP